MNVDGTAPWPHPRTRWVPTLKAYNALGLEAPDDAPDPSGDDD